MNKNIIIKAVGGFYDVLVPENQVLRCKLRGRLRLKTERVLVGDWVQIQMLSATEGIINEVLPRKNELRRPAIANIDQAVVIMAFSEPKPDFLLLDRILTAVTSVKLKPIICFNKTDLTKQPQGSSQIVSIYEDIGYQVIVTSVVDSQGIDQLHRLLQDRISMFAGPSGVGKSSLLNRIESTFELDVGSLSSKTKRGKHTTRRVELLPLSTGGLVADTPGFTQLVLVGMKVEELQNYFPEICKAANNCRFRGCLHAKEPNCAVIHAVKQNEISSQRYSNYLTLLNEVRALNTYN